MKILVVEDEKISSTILENLLIVNHYECETAANVDEALEKFATEDFGMVLLDWMMPGGSGLDVLRKIRQSDQYTGRHTHVIMVTTRMAAVDIKMAFCSGVDDFVIKPVNADIMMEKVEAGMSMISGERKFPACKDPVKEIDTFVERMGDLGLAKEILRMYRTEVVPLKKLLPDEGGDESEVPVNGTLGTLRYLSLIVNTGTMIGLINRYVLSDGSRKKVLMKEIKLALGGIIGRIDQIDR